MSSSWFPSGRNSESGWKLDIVSLLAVIGESSMDSHIQVLTSSWYCVLPRIIPAPQALLKPTRPTRLPQINAAVVGVHNGTLVPTLNYFPEILHPIDDLPAFSFKVLKITHKKEKKRKHGQDVFQVEEARCVHETDRILEDSTIDPRSVGTRHGIPTRKSTLRNLKRVMTGQDGRPRIPARKISPLNIVTILTFLWTCALIIWARIIRDGTAILALISISMVSSVVGFASWWQPVLMSRPSKSKVPAGDVVIRTREGAFLLVKCNEDVARELYTGTEECQYYVTTEGYRILVGIGTLLLMISVVLLGNCGFIMQAAIGISYMVLNGVFWAASLLDRTRFWNLSYYQVEDVTPKDSLDAHEKTIISTTDYDGITETQEQLPSFTRTMWYAIRETKKIGWVKSGGAAPRTAEWDEWLHLAEQHAIQGDRAWPAVKMRDHILTRGTTTTTNRTTDSGHIQEYTTTVTREQIPAFEVPPRSSR